MSARPRCIGACAHAVSLLQAQLLWRVYLHERHDMHIVLFVLDISKQPIFFENSCTDADNCTRSNSVLVDGGLRMYLGARDSAVHICVASGDGYLWAVDETACGREVSGARTVVSLHYPADSLTGCSARVCAARWQRGGGRWQERRSVLPK